MARIDEHLVMAHIDSELDAATAARVAEALESNSELRAMADEQRRLRERLAGHYGPVADEEIPSHLRAMLESNVIALPSARTRPGREFGWRAWGAMAATFIIGLIAAQLIPQRTVPSGVTGERLIAAGPLAETLDGQLVSEQPRSAPTRIGVSFTAKDGRMCRTFETQAMAGLACREGEGWDLIAHEPARRRPGGEYRQAASDTGVVMPISQELMKGEPFDSERERRARDTGWVSRR